MRTDRIAVGAIAGLVSLLVLAFAAAFLFGWPESGNWWMPHAGGPWMPHMGGWWGMSGWGVGMMVVGLLWLLLLLAVPLGLLYWLVSTGSAGDDPALRRLRERYASGEIDEEEYERRLRRLDE